MKRNAWAFFLFAAVLISVLPAHPIHAQDIRLIVRGDDLGMTQGSIAAFERSFNGGVHPFSPSPPGSKRRRI